MFTRIGNLGSKMFNFAPFIGIKYWMDKESISIYQANQTNQTSYITNYIGNQWLFTDYSRQLTVNESFIKIETLLPSDLLNSELIRICCGDNLADFRPILSFISLYPCHPVPITISIILSFLNDNSFTRRIISSDLTRF